MKNLINDIEIEGVRDALDILVKAGTEDLFEKAKHQIGDSHPKWPQLKWTDLGGGKFGWRTGTGRGKRGNTSSGENTSNSGEQKDLSTHAKETDTKTLKNVANSDKAPKDLKDAAKKELQNRGEGTETKEDKKLRPVGTGTNEPERRKKETKSRPVFTGNAGNAIKSSGLFGRGYANGKRSMGNIASINIGDPDTRYGDTPATVIYITPTGAYKTVSVTIDAEGKVTKDSGWQSSQSFSSLDDAKSYIEYGKRGRNIFTKKWEDEPGQGSTTKNNQGKTGKDFNIVGARAKDVADNVASVLGGKVTGDENVKVSGIPSATIKAYKITVGNDSFFIHDGVYERSYSQKGYARYKGFTVMKSDGSRIMKYKVNAAGTHFTNAFSSNAGELGSHIKQTWGYGK